jgi:hypothetical protein
MKSLAEIGYNAYRESAGGKSLVSGVPLPEFHELTEKIQTAWIAAAEAVKVAVSGHLPPPGQFPHNT